MSISKSGVTITSLEEWRSHAPPKTATQWKDGRSAKEVARSWLASAPEKMPALVLNVVEQNRHFGQVISWQAEPEARLRFDGFRGEPRNSDLAVYCEDRNGHYLMAVEAKADEPYGDTIGATMVAALERKLSNSCAKGIIRMEQLAAGLFEARRKGEPSLANLRYQLLTACAGALFQADRRRLDRALFFVQEFVTDATTQIKHRRNARDLDIFVQRLSHGSLKSICSGEILGPFHVPYTQHFSTEVKLFVGKLTLDIRKRHGA